MCGVGSAAVAAGLLLSCLCRYNICRMRAGTVGTGTRPSKEPFVFAFLYRRRTECFSFSASCMHGVSGCSRHMQPPGARQMHRQHLAASCQAACGNHGVSRLAKPTVGKKPSTGQTAAVPDCKCLTRVPGWLHTQHSSPAEWSTHSAAAFASQNRCLFAATNRQNYDYILNRQTETTTEMHWGQQ